MFFLYWYDISVFVYPLRHLAAKNAGNAKMVVLHDIISTAMLLSRLMTSGTTWGLIVMR